MPYPTSERRTVLLGLAALALVAGPARAQTVNFVGARRPSAGASAPAFLPYKPVAVAPLYRHRVVELLEFTCPYCRQIDAGAQAWGATLPRPFVFEQMPLVYDTRTAEIAATYYTVVLANPAIKNAIVASMFHAVQDLHADPADPRTYIRAAAAAGVTQAQFMRALRDVSGRTAYIRRAAAFARAVAPRATPTFVVDGSAVDAVDTGGDYQRLFRLLDGLVSEALVHSRSAP